MAVSSISNQNKIDLIKMALANKNTKSQAAQQPAYMQKTGSIFLAPGAYKNINNAAQQTDFSLNDDNIMKSLGELKPSTSGESAPTDGNNKNDDLAILGGKASASAGRAAAAEGETQANDLKGQTKEVQDDAKTSESYEKYAAKLDKSIVKDDKKFKADMTKQEASFKKDSNEMKKLNEENEQLQKEIDDAQKELESLNATSSFGIGEGNGNQDKINDLQQIIGAKVGKLQSNGKVVYSLQRNTQRTMKSMTSTSKQFINMQKTNTKALEHKESATEKIIKVANKVEEISTLVSQVGQALGTGGKVLVAIGAATSWAGVGAALISAGNIMQKIGTVVKMVGDYGQTAANITKTAAYAASGNLQGAMLSAASAVQTGAAAVKTSTNLKQTFGNINESTNAAKEKLASNVEAKVQVQAQQSSTMKELAAEKNINTENMTDKDIKKALGKEGVKQKDIDAKTFGTDAKGNAISAKQATEMTSAQLEKEKLNLGNTNQKFKNIDKAIKEKSEEAFAKAKESGFKNASSGLMKTASKISWDKVGKAANSTAAMLSKMDKNSQATNPINVKKPRPDTRGILNNPRTRNIIASNNRRRASLA